jgi:hypothetical protein
MIPAGTIKDVSIRPVPLPAADPRLVIGSDMMSLVYSNTAIIARKKSGTTKACTDRRLSVLLIAPTVHKASTYTAIHKILHGRRTPVTVIEDLYEDGEWVLDQLTERLQAPDSDEEPPGTLATRMFDKTK